MQDPDPQDLIAIGHFLVRYAQAIDASLRYRVAPLDFWSCALDLPAH